MCPQGESVSDCVSKPQSNLPGSVLFFSFSQRMERVSSFKYYTITVPDEPGANVSYINGALICRSEYPGTNQVFTDKVGYPKVPIKLWELSKPSGNISGLSLLIERSIFSRH